MAYDADGSHIAYTPVPDAFRSWKRYRGGRTTPLWIYDVQTHEVEVVPHVNASDTFPTWIGEDVYFDPNMDFGFVQTVAVLPFKNLTLQEEAAERVRDTFVTMLLATGAFYVVPSGEAARGVERLPKRVLKKRKKRGLNARRRNFNV